MNNKKRICFISRSAYPLFNPNCRETFGGAEVDLYIIAKALAKKDLFNLSFIVGDFGQKKEEIYEGVSVLRSYLLSEYRFIQVIRLLAQLFLLKADIYMVEGANGGVGIISLFCRFFNKKFVFRTASDIDCNGTFIKNYPLGGFFYKWGIKYADSVITQNQLNKEQLKESLNLDSIVIKNGLIIPKREYKNKEIILWVSRSEKIKQPYLFLDLARKFPNEKFIMICPKANFNSVDVADLIKEISKIHNLEFISYVPFAEINYYYKLAKVFVNTSIYEGFPNAFVQSAINATPIVSLNVDPDGFLKKNNCGICACGSQSVLENSLTKLLTDSDLWNTMSNNIYNYSLNNNNIEKVIPQYIKLFTSLIDKNV